MAKKLFAIRGATQCENTPADIEKQISSLYEELLSKNALTESDLVSLVFSVTPDLDALNPCTALRRSGWGQELALFAAQEPVVCGGLPRVIRALIHCYMDEASAPQHLYQNGAEVLRPDLKRL